jgi:hypothetical protein
MIRTINNFRAILQGSMQNSPAPSALPLAPADADKVLNALRTDSDLMLLTISDGTAIEIVGVSKVLDPQSNTWTLTCERGMDGTPIVAWAPGATVEGRITSGMLAIMPHLAVACALTDASGALLLDDAGVPLSSDAVGTYAYGGEISL